ncbi:MAG: peptidoglycan-associated lipoprotein [Candidatus Rokubacteria bacterium 13_1_40CM_69_27]|nr:MAG: peptidoglycan-associated lipoprotein [Candidatus Rokubacteria bacterium 13_1_40CM_69_27]OLC38618.1 MAG: peptidoglycan-associated lipoprotein [Candidatus Rokubacteria bacterium 13_1_40CM_4_69_5]
MSVRFHLIVLSALVMSVGLAGCDSGPSAPVGQAGPAQPARTAAAASAPSREFAAVAELRNIHFDLDQAKIRSSDARLLQDNARWLKSRRDMTILIGGHADERGSDDYNLKLGERRANAVRSYLIAQGVEADRVTTATYGERNPVCPEHTEACWAKNRRSEFQVKTR